MWHCILILIETTAPYGKRKELQVDKQEVEEKEDFDTLGPVSFK